MDLLFSTKESKKKKIPNLKFHFLHELFILIFKLSVPGFSPELQRKTRNISDTFAHFSEFMTPEDSCGQGHALC